jgi:alpha-L-fucosidase
VVAGSFADVKRPEFTAADFRFTTSDDGTTLYAIALAWPADGKLLVKSLATGADGAPSVTAVALLGHAGDISWDQTAAGLAVTLPAAAPSNHAVTLKISREATTP